MTTSRESKLSAAWLILILALAAALRLYGLGHDLPHVYNPDEANIMARSLGVARDPNPHYFLYPSFFFYVVFAWLGALFVAGRLAGRYDSLAAFERRFFADPTDFYLAGRVLGLFFAIATLWLTYRIAERRYGRTAALAAAFFLAVAYVHVRDSHYLKHDVPATFLILAAIACFERVMERGAFRDYVLSGVMTGVAFATHYYTIFLAPALALCHLARAKHREGTKLVAAGGVSTLVFMLLSPFVLWNLGETLAHLRENRRVVLDRSLDAGSSFLPSLSFYARVLAEQCWGYPLLALVAFGALLLARRGRKDVVLWGGFAVPFLVFLTFTFGAGRYLNPVLPAMAVAAGVAVAALPRAWGVLALSFALWPLYLDVQVDRLFGVKDTRTLAREWVLTNVPDGETIALQSFSVPLPQSQSSLAESLARNGAESELLRKGKFFHLSALAGEGGTRYRLFFLGHGDEKDRIYLDYAIDSLPAHDVRVVVLRDTPSESRRVKAFLEEVRGQAKHLARFPYSSDESLHPYLDNEDGFPSPALERKGPSVEIWSLEKP